jgi:hypothetical protein
LEKARGEYRALEIIQSGSALIYIETAGSFGIMLDVQIENISHETIRIDAIRLKMPWFGDLHWLKKLSSKVLCRQGGYVLPTAGPSCFDKSVVLNHLLVRDFKLYPGDAIHGFLFGEGAASVPEEFSDRRRVPMQLVIYSGGGKSYSRWMELVVSRKAHQMQCKPAIERRRRRLSLNK